MQTACITTGIVRIFLLIIGAQAYSPTAIKLGQQVVQRQMRWAHLGFQSHCSPCLKKIKEKIYRILKGLGFTQNDEYPKYVYKHYEHDISINFKDANLLII